MRKIGIAGVAVVLLMLLAIQAASAQSGWEGCPWGANYDPMANGYVPACFTRPASTAQAAVRPAGLANMEPFSVMEEIAARCPWGGYADATGRGFICNSNPASTAQVAAKQAAQAVSQNMLDCPAGAAYNPDVRGIQCILAPSAAVVATVRPAVVAQNTATDCAAWTANNPMLYSDVQDCGSGTAAVAQANPKVAGLASINPVAQAQNAASGCMYGNSYYDPVHFGPVAGCTDGPSVTMAQASPKVTGLANIEPVAAQKQKPECGPIGTLDLDPLAIPLACLSQ